MKDKRTTRAAIYGRVSRDGQTVDNQLRELRIVAEWLADCRGVHL